jgi:hypothetical protein
VGKKNCLETGWDASGNAGPSQTGVTSPQLPYSAVNPATTPLVTAGATPVFPAAASVVLGSTSTSTTTTTTTTTPPPPAGGGGTGPGTGTGSGTAPVDQPINVTVTGGQLVLSCAAPPAAVVTTCPLITLPGITLDGASQTVTGPANTIYVSDNRGNPAVGWSLTSYMVTTSSNPNTSCASDAFFCDSSVGASASNPNGQIPASDLAISAPTCAPQTGTSNPAATAGSGGSFPTAPGALTLCTAAAGQSGGTFAMTTNFSLTIPASNYAGTYMGTVEYLVS